MARALEAPVRRRRPLRGLALVLVVLVVAAASGLYAYSRVIGSLFNRTTLTLNPASGKAINILILGSDSRAGLTDPADIQRFGGSTDVSGQRSDTIILAQIVPSEQRGVLVGIPRDTWVPVHARGRVFYGKINSAYSYGPQAAIDTVGALTGLPINHYIEVNIAGFRNIVDAIGGIDICQPVPLYDSTLKFRLPAGMVHLDGNAALSFVRARHATPDGDFGRIKRQQQFFRAVVKKILRLGVLGNPIKVNQLARAFAQNVTVDQYFKLSDMIRLALSVHHIGLNQLETYTLPSDVGSIAGQSVVFEKKAEADALFQALRNVEDPRRTLAAAATPAPPPAAEGRTAAAPAPCPPDGA